MKSLSLNSILALSEKLGWGAMACDIAIPAIKRIVDNLQWAISDRTGDVEQPDEVAKDLLEYYTPDQTFALLGYNDDPNYAGSKEEHDMILLRGEIEELMLKGVQYWDALYEVDCIG